MSDQGFAAAKFWYGEIKLFFASGIFYIVLGCAFLWMSYATLNEAHSAFVFLLAVLGIAIVLYGTGTQAVGSGNTGPINVAIAGGAGVLAALFGFGVVTYQPQIEEVFKRTQDYAVLYLSVEGVTGDLSHYDIYARLGGSSQLPLYRDGRRIKILVPIDEDEPKTLVAVSLTSRGQTPEFRDYQDIPVEITWAEETVRRRSGLNNEVVPEIARPLTLVSSDVEVRSVTDKNEGAAGLAVTAQ